MICENWGVRPQTAVMVGDYVFELTDIGRDRARRYSEQCTYFGTAPVSLQDYIDSVELQSASDMTFLYDFGDNWEFDAVLERIDPLDKKINY